MKSANSDVGYLIIFSGFNFYWRPSLCLAVLRFYSKTGFWP